MVINKNSFYQRNGIHAVQMDQCLHHQTSCKPHCRSLLPLYSLLTLD